ncbi:hypothetical protein LPB72_08485 [Hydrogenophaga crassostreae]|uniref:Transmembrane protein n=1 Tax=Hydrogenophaga crassostreae TaxID=1763535 RepID=A0A167ICI0_9BURK|nr:YfiR family protein [Hydrogenophaga crassostreae]AOW12456.1 hypothetical protein LPB072_05905 [Hydrogenophaga crassostreae]OAD42508.1 hypothetical protein LPB72_08485 [Hydrogenophaga crassostreae]
MPRLGSAGWLLPWRLLAAACLLALAGPTGAQATSEQAIKVAFVFNFVKFTQWPHARETLLFCTQGAQPLDWQFGQFKGQMVNGRTLDVRHNVPSGEWRGCDVLFLSKSDAGVVDSVQRILGNAPTLTIADLPDYAQNGGMIALRVEGTRLRFDVNLAAVQRAGLVLSGQMVKLAGKVLQ